MSKTWKIAFCGLGSIGKRHLRNLSRLLAEMKAGYTIDLIRSNKCAKIPNDIKKEINKIYGYEDEIDSDYDIIFVTNPTSLHFQSIQRYCLCTKSMFIEKPLFEADSYDLSLLERSGCIFYVACPIRYKKVIQQIKKMVPVNEALSAIAICSSFLPGWREGVDYKECYSSKRDLGGGVSLDLIHEMDYLTYLWGMPTEIYNIRGHVSSLEIDCDDVSVYLAGFGDKVAQIYLDYYGKEDIRKLILFTRNETFEIDLLKNTITKLSNKEQTVFHEVRDDYQIEELIHFFKIIDGEIENDNDLHRAYAVLKLSLGRIL